MTIDTRKAREFIYANGTLFERALYGWLFEDLPVSTLHGTIRAYKNPDGGYGHGFEHDIKAPYSHPLALEYLLQLLVRFKIPVDDLLIGTTSWLESVQAADGSLSNPDTLSQYPIAPWWVDMGGGQTKPASIIGNLTRLGAVNRQLAHRTRKWVANNLTLETIAKNEWLFMVYHSHDYFMNVEAFPQIGDYRAAIVENILMCAETAPQNQWSTLFNLAYAPDSPAEQVIPSQIINRFLDYVEISQQDDGSWHDQHELPQWYTITTISNLNTLRAFGRLITE